MKHRFLTIIPAFLCLIASYSAYSQQLLPEREPVNYPDTITVPWQELSDLFHYGKGEIITHSSKYLHNGQVLLNTTDKDPHGKDKLMRIQLAYFPGAFLWVQVNGNYSTQVFILSEKPAWSYKSHFSANKVVLVKCRKESIISE